ncbi:MAG: VOC family protein [Myxococcales bacterium]|nr:VOC family protein [Myxococcales bacterium]
MTPENAAPELDSAPSVSTFCWDELVSQDPAAASRFLTKVFGYATEQKDMGPMGPYTILKRGDKQAGGIMKAMQPKVPSAWLGYVVVTDLDATHKKAQRMGATEIVPEISVPDLGRFTVVADKQGAMIGLFQGA